MKKTPALSTKILKPIQKDYTTVFILCIILIFFIYRLNINQNLF